MYATTLSQHDYIRYSDYLQDIEVLEKYCRKQKISEIGFIKDRFVKVSSSDKECKTIFDKLQPQELEVLRERVKFINGIHEKLTQTTLDAKNADDCMPLAAHEFNKHRTIISTAQWLPQMN